MSGFAFLCDFCDGSMSINDEDNMVATTLAEPQAADAPHQRIEACSRGDRATPESVFREHTPMLSHLIARPVSRRIQVNDRVNDQADARCRLGRLEFHLTAIGARRRLAFVVYVIDGCPLAEVATLVNAMEIATGTRVMRARRALIARLRRNPAADLVEALT